MIAALTQLLLFQLAGEVISRALNLPVPGAVLGMALLFVFLCIRGGASAEMEKTTGYLLRYMSILFVPAGVGVMLILPILQTEGLPIVLATLISTGLAIAVTGWLAQRLSRWRSDTDPHD
ncbi:murein hydrolase transporter LrgA [Betaproteobacteria bacterium]|nr:murein hydrolase transporter LrgA [Betaproteobacteria bacterium]